LYQKYGVFDYDTSRPIVAKLYLEILTHLTTSNKQNSSNENVSSVADFEHIKAMLETAISERCSVFILYIMKKKRIYGKRYEEEVQKEKRTVRTRRHLQKNYVLVFQERKMQLRAESDYWLWL
jgi:hypothetical protein